MAALLFEPAIPGPSPAQPAYPVVVPPEENPPRLWVFHVEPPAALVELLGIVLAAAPPVINVVPPLADTMPLDDVPPLGDTMPLDDVPCEDPP